MFNFQVQKKGGLIWHEGNINLRKSTIYLIILLFQLTELLNMKIVLNRFANL